MLLARLRRVQYEWTKMIRKQLLLGLFSALLLAAPASAQSTQTGEGDASGGSGSGNVQSGSGQVTPAPTRAPQRPAATPRPATTPFRAAPTPAPTAVSRPRAVTPATAPRPAAKPKAKAHKPSSGAGLANGLSAKEASCLAPIERTVLRRRAKGLSLRAIAAELDMSTGAVSAAEQRGLRRLVVRSDPGRCAKSAGARKAKSSKERRVAAKVVLATERRATAKRQSDHGRATATSTPAQGQPSSVAMFLPKKTGRGGLFLILLAVLLILGMGMAIHLWTPAFAEMRRARSIRRDPFKRR
jgi:DNA-binding CsgD family transcriptional regulator